MRTTINIISWAIFLALLSHMSDLEFVHKKEDVIIAKKKTVITHSFFSDPLG